MTKEPIMIDDVDVSGCYHLAKIQNTYKCEMYYNENCDCSIRTDCYYKQLKRKEKECEKLKKELHKNFEEKDKLHLIIDRLLEASGYDTNTASAEDFEDVYENMRYEKQQLDQFKAECEEWKNKYYSSITEVKADLIKQLDQLKAYIKDDLVPHAKLYKQALQEIKKIAKDDCKTCTVKLLGEDKINCKRCYKTKILQKCEVIKDANIQS